MKGKKIGFTMVELLVVLLIVGILAAVAAPLYLANTKRAKASEAVATMSLVRQALRDYFVGHNAYFSIGQGNISTQPPTGVDVNAAVAQYFSNMAFNVTATNPAWTDATISPLAVHFKIAADGSQSENCTASPGDCAVKNTEVSDYRLEMDNSGRIFVSYDNGGNWSAW